ncbi:hypothetical protein JOC55_005729 [Paenibacillus sacheonensis]|nr:hypothetical protein [Paenibacillus sacheonensis]
MFQFPLGIANAAGTFASGVETSDIYPTWSSTIESSSNVAGYSTGINPELFVDTDRAYMGSRSLHFSGKDNSTSQSSIYFKVFDVNVTLDATSKLSYWTYPEQNLARYVAVDLVFTDGTYLRDSGAVDMNGVALHPNTPRGTVNQWSQTKSNIGAWVSGKTVDRILIAYDHAADTGQFKGSIDDIQITSSNPGAFFGGVESQQIQPTWTDTTESINNVGAYSTGAPELGVRQESAHSGTKALMYSGKDNSTSASSVYFKVFDVNIPVDPTSTLEYWIYPQQNLGRYVGVDLIYTDGTNLRDSGAVDTNGGSMHPSAPRGTANQWTQIKSNIGAWASGKTIDRILIAYDHAPETGQFRGYIDDLMISSLGIDYALLKTPSSTSLLTDEKAAGITNLTFELGWDQYEQSQGSFNSSYISSKQAIYNAYKNAGFRITLDVGLQYPPAWVFNLDSNTRFKNQYGDVWSSSTIGNDVPNAVFNANVRNAQANYIARVKQDFPDVYAIRVGGLGWNELRYPDPTFNGHTNSYWVFDANAQAGSSVPGWKPGDTDTTKAQQFIDYYFQKLTDYSNWLIGTYSNKYPNAYLYVLYPSSGIRPGDVAGAVNVRLNGSTAPEINGQLQMGLDWERQINALTNPKAIPYCTWTEQPGTGGTHNLESPLRYMAYLANVKGLRIAGENSGNNTAAQMAFIDKEARALNMTATFWMNESQFGTGTNATLSDYANLIP